MAFSMNELSPAASLKTMLYQDFRFEDCVSYLLLCAKLVNGQRISIFFFGFGALLHPIIKPTIHQKHSKGEGYRYNYSKIWLL